MILVETDALIKKGLKVALSLFIGLSLSQVETDALIKKGLKDSPASSASARATS